MDEMALTENFRINLRAAMKARDMSQADIALAMDPEAEDQGRGKQPYVGRVLSGKTVPGLDQCERLASAVKMPMQFLLLSPEEFSRTLLTDVA